MKRQAAVRAAALAVALVALLAATVAPDATAAAALAAGSDTKGANRWQRFPWQADSWPACSRPSSSPGARASPRDRASVVILGDSLIRDSRSQLTSALHRRGFEPVFVCWGGMGLQWGEEQVEQMRASELLPRCLVVNLGVNDLKGTTEKGLADAVGITKVGQRLNGLLAATVGIEHVLVMDVAADAGRAPSTLADVGRMPALYREVAAAAGVGTVLPWAARAAGLGQAQVADGVHDTRAAARARARLIARSVQHECD